MTCFADSASAIVTRIIHNTQIARGTMRLRICVPDMARHVVPGQFFMLRNPGGNDPLIGRAFALYDLADDDSGWFDLVYIVKGKLTSSLVKLKAGDEVAVWGPLGNGFATTPTQHLIMVAGGIGQTPFVTLAREAMGQQHFRVSEGRSNGYAARVSLCYGVRTAAYLAGVDDFRATGSDVHIATEDGSIGPPQRVTDILARVLSASQASSRIVCCGPEPMMEAVAAIAARHAVDCQVSLETPMACGIGICFSCVAKVGSENAWDYKRTCVEGPVFDSREIVWH